MNSELLRVSSQGYDPSTKYETKQKIIIYSTGSIQLFMFSNANMVKYKYHFLAQCQGLNSLDRVDNTVDCLHGWHYENDQAVN